MTIRWNCAVCLYPVDDNYGYVHADMQQINEAQEERRFGGSPPTVHWHPYHYGCAPEGSDGPYGFEVERVRSAVDLEWWDSHLRGKAWCALTDWCAVHRAAARQVRTG